MKNRYPFYLRMSSAETKEHLALLWLVLACELRYFNSGSIVMLLSTLILSNRHWNWKAEFKLSRKANTTTKLRVFYFMFLLPQLPFVVWCCPPCSRELCLQRYNFCLEKSRYCSHGQRKCNTATVFSNTPTDQQGHWPVHLHLWQRGCHG